MKSTVNSSGDFNHGVILASPTPTVPSSDTTLFDTLYPGYAGHYGISLFYSHDFRFAASIFNTLAAFILRRA